MTINTNRILFCTKLEVRPLRRRLRHARAARGARGGQARGQVRGLRPRVLHPGGAQVARAHAPGARPRVRALRQEVPEQDSAGDAPGTEFVALFSELAK